MKKILLQTISVIEMLLLIIIGILSNKVAELLQINGISLFLLTLATVTVLAVITVLKTNVPDKTSKKSSHKEWNVKPTKGTVTNILQGIIYLPSALLLSNGAFQYSRAMVTAGVLFFLVQ